MKLTKSLLKNLILEVISEANVDQRTGYPLDDEGWSNGETRQNFLNSQIGKVWLGAHRNSGGKFDTTTGVPIGGLKNFPVEKLYPFMDMIDKMNSTQADSEKYYNDKIAAARAEAVRAEKEAEEAIAALKNKLNSLNSVPSQQSKDSYQRSQDALNNANTILKSEYDLNQKLKTQYEKSPEQSSKEEIQLFKKIVQPYLDQTDEVLNTDSINTPEELNVFLKTVYQPYIKKSRVILQQFASEVDKAGVALSKPYVKMLLDTSNQNLDFARKSVQFWRKNTEELQKYIK